MSEVRGLVDSHEQRLVDSTGYGLRPKGRDRLRAPHKLLTHVESPYTHHAARYWHLVVEPTAAEYPPRRHAVDRRAS